MHMQPTNGKSTADNLAVQRFSTAAFTPRERFAVWRELYGHTIVRLDFEAPAEDQLMVEATLRNLPGLGVASIASTEVSFRKSRSFISNDDIILMIADTGKCSGSHVGREVELEPGDAVLCMNSEVLAGTSFGRRTLIRLPNSTIAPALTDIGAKISRRIPRETEGLQLLRHYLRVTQDAEALATPQLQRLAVTHICDLLALTVGATRDATQAAEDRGGRAARLRAIKEDIVRNLEHGDVSVGAVAARHRMSPRTLQKLFDGDGTTFSEYVLDQRLALAYRMLTALQRPGEKIASIAFTAGFGDVSYFYRAFRRRYGLLPTDVRAQVRRSH